MTKNRLSFTFIILAFFVLFYFYAFNTITSLNGEKFYNSNVLQSDVITYLDYYSREIAGRPFFEWFLKLEKANVSLTYFSAIIGYLSDTNIPDMVLTLFFMGMIFCFIRKILSSTRSQALWTSLSLLLLFPFCIYSQTISKELLLLGLTILFLWSVFTERILVQVVALIFIFAVRVYFGLISLGALILFLGYQKYGKRFIQFVFFNAIFILPFLYKKIFANFFAITGIKNATGLTGYFLAVVDIPGSLILWAPVRICQNLMEPLIGVTQQDWREIIYSPSILLETLASMGTFIFLILFLNSFIKYRTSLTNATKMLAAYLGVYLLVIGFLPIIHFRYLSLILPFFGMFIDLVESENSENQSFS